jgi:hypothetical protein
MLGGGFHESCPSLFNFGVRYQSDTCLDRKWDTIELRVRPGSALPDPARRPMYKGYACRFDSVRVFQLSRHRSLDTQVNSRPSPASFEQPVGKNFLSVKLRKSLFLPSNLHKLILRPVRCRLRKS